MVYIYIDKTKSNQLILLVGRPCFGLVGLLAVLVFGWGMLGLKLPTL